MRKPFRVLSLFLLMLFLLSAAGCSRAGITPLLWKATSPYGGEVYLFGSVHVGDKEMAGFPGYVNDAFSESEILAVELDIVAIEQDIAAALDLMPYIIYSDGSTVRDHIPPDLYASAKEKLQEYGLYYDACDDFQAYVWQEMLSERQYRRAGFTDRYGVDRVLIKSAKETGKTIYEIETVEQQMALMGGEKLQELLLRDAVASAGTWKADLAVKMLVVAWKSGDQKLMEQLVFGEDEQGGLTAEEMSVLEEFDDAVLNKRNKTMTEVAQRFLEEGRHAFYVVGMAHMIGEEGIVSGLIRKGYTVAVCGD
ncbi:MAG: TraB/GumN family protein [Christensenellales bacterium]